MFGAHLCNPEIKALLPSTYHTTCLKSKSTKTRKVVSSTATIRNCVCSSESRERTSTSGFLGRPSYPAEWELSNDLPDEDVLVIEVTPPWKMYFDGASHKEGAGAGVIFITSDGEVLPYSFTLTQNCSNNAAEYQALILGLEMAVDIKQLHLKVFGDSKLVINQLLGLYEVKKTSYFHISVTLKDSSDGLEMWKLSTCQEKDNKQADALAKLASTLTTLEDNARVPICKSWVVPPIFDDDDCEEEEELHAIEVFDIEKEDWRQRS
ncbi:UNVERIFIED_CONTAM: hypothetical protein Slati_1905600 [Sesamum latifolium]|uniref:RNase H type-1 domain-containing protein n=1 Tax=Sesamum latifolium TaxID=2727402 RepID=A0AAW2X0P3_9LAMI